MHTYNIFITYLSREVYNVVVVLGFYRPVTLQRFAPTYADVLEN